MNRISFPSEAPRILIARLSAIGDTILTVPVACALRERYPRAFLAWIVEEKSAAVLAGHESLDEVIVAERGWFTSPRAAWELRRRLRSRKFDATVDCQGLTKSALVCWLSGARWRIGLAGRHGRELSRWFNNVCLAPSCSHVVDRSLELLAPLDVAAPPVTWKLPIPPRASARAEAISRELGLERGYAVINPGATWDSKLWEMDRFAAVARHLGARHGLPTLVVWGGAREATWALEIVTAAGGYAVLAPPTDLAELSAVIRRARLFVSADTGPLHMAVAVGTPSIGLYGPTRPEDCGPYGPPHVAIQMRYHSGSSRQRRRADNSAMRLIASEMVAAHCDALLRATATPCHGTAA